VKKKMKERKKKRGRNKKVRKQKNKKREKIKKCSSVLFSFIKILKSFEEKSILNLFQPCAIR
jgi:hypothetical protein